MSPLSHLKKWISFAAADIDPALENALGRMSIQSGEKDSELRQKASLLSSVPISVRLRT
jgi:hypothetical protein